jgi:hypothetical protein
MKLLYSYPGLLVSDDVEAVMASLVSPHPTNTLKGKLGLAGGFHSMSCNEVRNEAKKCLDGFSVDAENNYCYVVLENPSSKSTGINICSDFQASLLELKNEAEVNGLLKLLKTGYSFKLETTVWRCRGGYVKWMKALTHVKALRSDIIVSV